MSATHGYGLWHGHGNAPHATWRDALASAAVFANAHLSQFLFAWMLGVLLLSVRLTFGWIKAHRIATKNAAEATSEWQRVARRLAHALRMGAGVRGCHQPEKNS